jgi:hypothetical protein
VSACSVSGSLKSNAGARTFAAALDGPRGLDAGALGAGGGALVSAVGDELADAEGSGVLGSDRGAFGESELAGGALIETLVASGFTAVE